MQKLSTKQVVNDYGAYLSGSDIFFDAFKDAYESVKKRVIKLETRQIYREPENMSYVTLLKLGLSASIPLIEETKEEDFRLYHSLAQKGVAFIRCRPIKYPLTEYLKWELECYKVNIEHGERIFFTEDMGPFTECALHDFMVFDHNFAAVHDYDSSGLIRGGWLIQNPDGIAVLDEIFRTIMATSKRIRNVESWTKQAS